MNDHDPLLNMVLAQPDDIALRLVYADWLEEHGQEERAEFIRCQVELARIRPEKAGGLTVWSSDEAAADDLRSENPHAERLRRRERDLLGYPNGVCLHCDWHAPIPHGGFEWEFRRGFVEVVSLPLAAWLEHGPALVRRHPIRELRIPDLSEEECHVWLNWAREQAGMTPIIKANRQALRTP